MANEQVMDTTETDDQVLAQEAYAELDAEARGEQIPAKKKPDAEAAKPAEEQPAEEAAVPSDEEKAAEAAAKAKADEAKSEEEIAAENVIAHKAAADAKAKEAFVPDAQEVEEYAVKHSLTYAEAKEEIVKTAAIIEKYKGDPKELARALRSQQSEYGKLKSQVDDKPKERMFQRMTDEQFLHQAKAHFTKTPDEQKKHVDTFRQRFPAKSDMMTDEAIIEEIAERALGGYKQYAEKQEGDLRTAAADKRDKVLSELDESDKKFLPDVKAVLSKTADHHILSNGFDVKDIVHWAKGQRYDPDVKAAYARGRKDEKEGAVILGAKEVGGGGGPKKPAGASAGGWAGTADQKHRAIEMFPDTDGYTEEKSYQMFKETFAEELKKNPKFV